MNCNCHLFHSVHSVPDNCISSAQPEPPEDHPMNKIFLVEIIPNDGPMIRKHVVAREEKSALISVIESILVDDRAWQAPRWRSVQVFEASQPFIL